MDGMEQQRRYSAKRAILIVFIIALLVAYFCQAFITVLLDRVHQFLTRTSVFFFCNVILLFLARNSGLLVFFRTFTDKGFDDSVTRKSNQEQADGVEFKAIHAVLAESEVLGVEQGGPNDRVEVVIFEESEALCDHELKKMYEEFIERVKRERMLEALQLVKV